VTPVVGVTSYTPGAREEGSFELPCAYVESLRAAGAEVVLLATGTAQALLPRVDALVLAGGGDVDPGAYGGEPHETNYMIDPVRDAFELDLVRDASVRRMPILAICRGMQILNVARGGTLVAHVPERWGENVVHRAPPRAPIPHEVHVDAGSRLADIVGAGRLDVVSWHHQAIDALGGGLRVVARSDDGVPEAVETPKPEWIFGVQWHPELDARVNPRQHALLRAAVEAAAHYARSRIDATR
jgi:putative glutamine amidotransferase